MIASAGTNSIANLHAVKYLRVKETDVSGVSRVGVPRTPWNLKKGIEERKMVVLSICQKFRYLALWLSDIYGPDQKQSIVNLAIRKTIGWSFPSQSEVISVIEDLSEGGWGLFFFDRDPRSSLNALSILPTDARSLLELLEIVSAGAAIISWYDDNEWIVACAPA